MSILRVLAILTLILFLATTNVVFAWKYSNSGVYPWADIATRMYHFDAWAWAPAGLWEEGYYSIWAQVGNDNDYEGGSYDRLFSDSVSASGSRSVGQPAPVIFHNHYIN